MAKNSIEFYVQKLDGEPFKMGRYDQSLYDLFQEQAPAGRYKVTYARKLPDKSQKQLGVVFGLVIGKTLAAFENLGYDTSYLLKLDKPTGTEVTVELLKEYLYAVCPIFDEQGKRVTLSKMDVAQATKFINDIRNFISSQWEIYIDDPDKDWGKENKK